MVYIVGTTSTSTDDQSNQYQIIASLSTIRSSKSKSKNNNSTVTIAPKYNYTVSATFDVMQKTRPRWVAMASSSTIRFGIKLLVSIT